MTTADAITIGKEDLPEWLTWLGEQAQLIAPASGLGGDVLFAAISSPQEVLWEFENSLQPPKRFVLPQTDPLVKIGCDSGGFHPEPVYDDRRRIIFNIRNCDVSGFLYLHRMHSRDLPDTSYLRRAANTTLVSLACTQPCRLGFCVCSGAGPFLRAGFDLQLTAMDERVFVEIGSGKGRSLTDGAAGLFRVARLDEVAERERLEANARSLFGEETCHFGSAMRRISTGRVAKELWDTMGDWCLECGGCNFACPTCYCFSVKDRAVDDLWMRCRIWDSCQYAAFTLEASGHNPRTQQCDRMWRRFFHKVSAQYYQRDGEVGCVGCGRCIQVCMGTTDMPAVVEAIRKGEWHG